MPSSYYLSVRKNDTDFEGDLESEHSSPKVPKDLHRNLF